MRVYTASVVEQLIDIKRLTQFFQRKMLHQLAVTKSNVPKRTLIFKDKPFSVFGSMPAVDECSELFIVKNAALVTGGNLSAIHAITNVFCTKTGVPLALIDGDSMTGLRTAAASAAIAMHCTPELADSLGIIGAGVQAEYQVHAILSIRPIKQISIYSRTHAKALKLRAVLLAQYSDIVVDVVDNVSDCVSNKKIVITATTSNEPVFSLQKVSPGTHIGLIGSHSRVNRELSHQEMSQHTVVTENREFAIVEAGDVHSKAIEPNELFEMPHDDLASKISIFSSIGTALMDLYFVEYLLSLEETSNLNCINLKE
ncbi:ornithine cyclodeaminase [Pseudoalteromonas citrea]|uniref:Ornithine cyclodeaminase n=2 Tax=Pseudoalteromonas citrea TaxID=43655 RepID=A0AAD4AJJ1_9GAMM|nr:ornithine cyclodeaminase family protein [Pseudoalteromonas citrea]KAF7772079.1 ornithine cyclodeaminase [Pseudoalteromonas citrea]